VTDFMILLSAKFINDWYFGAWYWMWEGSWGL